MKTILKILLLSGLMAIMAFSCVKTKYAATAPGLAVYKTRGDYFNNAFVFMNSSGIYGYMGYYNPNGNLISRFKIEGTDTVYALRIRLVDGYVLADEWSKDMVFLNWTMNQFLDYEINHHTGYIPIDTLKKHILDANPFIELYCDPNRPRKFELSDSAEINQIIKKGELGKYFKRIK